MFRSPNMQESYAKRFSYTPEIASKFPRMHRGKLLAMSRDFNDTWTYTISMPEGFNFVPGQFTHLMAPGDGLGEGMVRHMSIASIPEEKLLRFSMDLSSNSPYKQRFRNCRPGDEIRLFKTKGQFTIEGVGEEEHLLFIAGGIGITPVRSLTAHIHHSGISNPWTLLYVGDEYLYKEGLIQFCKGTGVNSPVPTRSVLFINRSQIPANLDALFSNHYWSRCFISGSDGFVESLKNSVLNRGMEESLICLENFRT